MGRSKRKKREFKETNEGMMDIKVGVTEGLVEV